MFLSPPSRVVASLGALFETQGVPRGAAASRFWELARRVRDLGRDRACGRPRGRAVALLQPQLHADHPAALRHPQITILPLFILYFGIGPPSKIAFGVTHGIFPIIVTVAAGVQNIKPILMTAAHSMGASRWQIFRWVIFPHMIPSFFAGMRLGMTGVLLGVLLAELYVSTAGIGYFTQLFTQNFDPTKLLGLISVLAAMAIVLNEIVRRAESALRPLADGLAGRADTCFASPQQQLAFLLDRRDEALGQLGEQPRQRHFEAQVVVEHMDHAAGALAHRAKPEGQRVALPDLLLDGDQMAEAGLGLAKAVLQAADRTVLAEPMGDRHHQWSRHRRASRSRWFRSSATLRRFARHITSKASPSSGTAPTTPSSATFISMRAMT